LRIRIAIGTTRPRHPDTLKNPDTIAMLDCARSDTDLCTRLICKEIDGTEHNIVFDTIAYLCEAGKTVEKITGGAMQSTVTVPDSKAKLIRRQDI